MAFSSRPLLRAHEEKLCLGMPAATRSRLPRGDPLPVEGAPGTVGKPQDTGPRRARGAPLGDVLTPRERALLRAADPASRRTAVEDAPAQRPAPPQGHRQRPRELVEAHDRHMAEIRARTQQLEQQREGLCQQLAALRAQAAMDPHRPKQGDVELIQAPAAQQDLIRHLDAAHRQ
ncbi:hypothetical protein AAES_45332 [Amazona aestiva]|uniref:Uncharacterized protein n=1 Tax=Amazona aestiva TaxID=12930 RepID=A0A0Q3Q999_AMAAE|nr:hypothetical protein AAES_45332 [Amazona aestiva]